MSVITKETTNSSVLQTIGISALKGAAINLGVQAVGRNLKKDNLLSTLAVGAVAGIADSFIESKIPNSRGIASGAMSGLLLGGGNAIINKSSIGGTALKYAVITAVVEGVFNIARANAIPNYETKNWKIRRIYKLPNGNLPFYHQKNSSFGCTQETLKSICDYLKIPIAFLDYPVDLNPTNKNKQRVEYRDGADFEQLAKANGLNVETAAHFEVNGNRQFNPDIIGAFLENNIPLAITYTVPGDLPHTVGINRIIRLKNILKPTKEDRYIIEVMDPLYYNRYQQLPINVFNTGTIRLVQYPNYYV